MQLNWGPFDNLDIYAFVGARLASRMDSTLQIGPMKQTIVFDLGNGLLTGVGVKGTFYRSPSGFYVGGGASFEYAQTNRDLPIKIYVYNVLAVDTRSAPAYSERDMAATADLHAGWCFEKVGLTPYVGVEYRWNREDFDARAFGFGYPLLDLTAREKHPVGVYVGVDYAIKDRLFVNVEGHMVDRWGGSLSIGYKFDICGKTTPAVAPAVAPAPPAPAPTLTPMSQN